MNPSERPLRALVTAGGTREPIDDVRFVTNLSRGRFGAAIARALAARGVETTVLGSDELLRTPHAVPAGVRSVPFSSFADLARELDGLVSGSPPDLLFMAAAVSDYSPVRVDGKISSAADEIVVRMRRNPKLLAALRERCGVGTFLVGFKLLSGVPRADLVATALRQVQNDRLNLTVANDLADLTEMEHPVVLVTPEGGAIPMTGSRAAVAERLVDFVLRRFRVRWCHSVLDPALAAAPDAGSARAARLLVFAQDGGLLPGTAGNVSARADTGDVGTPGFGSARVDTGGLGTPAFGFARADTGGLWTTPRRVAKATVRPDELVRVEVDLSARRSRYRGARKPSIDSPVHAWLYRRLPGLAALLHFHDALVLADAETAFPFPCGTLEEAEEIHRALAGAAADGRWRGGSFAIRMRDHGWLLGFDPDGVERVAREWDAARAAHREHLASVGEAAALVPSPVFASTRIAGVFARDPQRGWSTLFLLPSERGRGIGEQLLERLEGRAEPVAVHDGCGVLAYYLERGWRPARREGAITVLESPARRTDLQPAVSVCLYDPAGRRILLARRLTEPWKGHWTFPGGRVQPGEDPHAAAVRELAEETGLDLPAREPAASFAVHLGTDEGRQGFVVACHVHFVLDTPAPRPSGEVEAVWISLEEACARRPLAPGTRRVLAALVDGLGRSAASRS